MVKLPEEEEYSIHNGVIATAQPQNLLQEVILIT